jgi:hypothetical protein
MGFRPELTCNDEVSNREKALYVRVQDSDNEPSVVHTSTSE